jgi:hypothetical protein
MARSAKSSTSSALFDQRFLECNPSKSIRTVILTMKSLHHPRNYPRNFPKLSLLNIYGIVPYSCCERFLSRKCTASVLTNVIDNPWRGIHDRAIAKFKLSTLDQLSSLSRGLHLPQHSQHRKIHLSLADVYRRRYQGPFAPIV